MLALGAAQTQSEPPAAAKRPNLQVLTTVPESQLFLMMNAIADSLGVRCEYCHARPSPDPTKSWSFAGGWAWDRDDKPPKRIAREMMRMVLDINTRQFDGRMRVTCYTCHRGSLDPGRLPPLPPRDYTSGAEPSAPTLPTVDEVWNKYVHGVGEPKRELSTTVLTATDERSEGRHGTLEVILKGADQVRYTLRMPPDAPTIQALNGDTGWGSSGSGTRAFTADEIARTRRAAVRYRPIKIEPPANWRITGVERIGNRDAYVAVTEVDARTKTMWYFDVATGLLLRERTTTETSFVPLQQQIDYDDYRRVDGVMLPFAMRTSDGAPFSTSRRVFTSIRHNVKVDDQAFAMPAPTIK
jgi:hypothetical protein